MSEAGGAGSDSRSVWRQARRRRSRVCRRGVALTLVAGGVGRDAGEEQAFGLVRLCWELLAELLRLSHSRLRSSSTQMEGLALTSGRVGISLPPFLPSSVGGPSPCGCRRWQTRSDTSLCESVCGRFLRSDSPFQLSARPMDFPENLKENVRRRLLNSKTRPRRLAQHRCGRRRPAAHWRRDAAPF